MPAADTLKTVIDTAKAVKQMVLEEAAVAIENLANDLNVNKFADDHHCEGEYQGYINAAAIVRGLKL